MKTNTLKVEASETALAVLVTLLGNGLLGYSKQRDAAIITVREEYTIETIKGLAGEQATITVHETPVIVTESPMEKLLRTKKEADAEKAEKDAKYQQEEDARARLLFLEIFQTPPDSIVDGVVYAGGLKLKYDRSCGAAGFQVAGTCPKCGEECWSYTRNNLNALSTYISPDGFESPHRCKTKPNTPKPKSTGEKFLDVLVELIEEYSYQGE